jgi:hypothetical protein
MGAGDGGSAPCLTRIAGLVCRRRDSRPRQQRAIFPEVLDISGRLIKLHDPLEIGHRVLRLTSGYSSAAFSARSASQLQSKETRDRFTKSPLPLQRQPPTRIGLILSLPLAPTRSRESPRVVSKNIARSLNALRAFPRRDQCWPGRVTHRNAVRLPVRGALMSQEWPREIRAEC